MLYVIYIYSANHKITQQEGFPIKEKQTNPRNCRNKNECPLNGSCKVQNVIYKCNVSAM